jgi:hypothetical protein
MAVEIVWCWPMIVLIDLPVAGRCPEKRIRDKAIGTPRDLRCHWVNDGAQDMKKEKIP